MSSFFAWIMKLFGWSNKPTQPEVNTPNVPPTNNQTEITMNKKCLCVGINDYVGTNNDLAGCINDCNDWANILTSKFGFGSVTKLQNSQATRQGIKNALQNLVANAKAGDVLVFTYSGHGSFVVDMTSPKPDHKNETIYTYDGNLFDYEFRAIFDGLPDGVSMTVILDSCHSGTATRFVQPGSPKPRFMPPRDPGMAELSTLPTAKRLFISEGEMKETLYAGAKSSEYSYDALVHGRPNGAFTATAIDAINKFTNPTNKQVYNEIRRNLPSNDWPQTPQLEGSESNKAKPIFS